MQVSVFQTSILIATCLCINTAPTFRPSNRTEPSNYYDFDQFNINDYSYPSDDYYYFNYDQNHSDEDGELSDDYLQYMQEKHNQELNKNHTSTVRVDSNEKDDLGVSIVENSIKTTTGEKFDINKPYRMTTVHTARVEQSGDFYWLVVSLAVLGVVLMLGIVIVVVRQKRVRKMHQEVVKPISKKEYKAVDQVFI